MSLSDRYNDLNQQWLATFGEQIPLAQLPADEGQALELIERALASGSQAEIDAQLPPGALA